MPLPTGVARREYAVASGDFRPAARIRSESPLAEDVQSQNCREWPF